MPLPFYSDFNKEAGAQSREKAKAERRVQQFQSSEKKDWDSFTANTARKSFVQQLGKDPMTDPKLLQYADNMNRLKTGTKVGTVPGEAGKSYEITKLRGSERLGCTCNDWRYKRSVAQPGEEQDCKHIKQYRQMSKTAADEAGKSVVVTGHSGSGKSTYANELSRRTGLPVVSLDKEPEIRDLLENQKTLFRETGSLGLSQTKDAERRALQAALSRHVDSPKILEGSYFLGHTDLIPDGAETVLVNRPLDVILDQRIKRDVARAKEKGKAPDPARIEKVTRELHRYYEPGVAELLRRGVKTAAASFKDTLPNPVIDGKPHSGTWTIVGSGRLSIPKKTSDIDYMVPLEEVKDLSGFQEYKDVPGVFWRDSETIDGRPSTIVALPRYAYDKIDASYQQATDRFGKRKLRQLKKTLPKDSFYKDIGVVYTSDAMKKESAYEEGGSFTHDGQEYSLREAFRTARTKPTEQMAVDKLKWVLQYGQSDPLRVASADLKAPVIVAPDRKGRPTVVDGHHRLSKAVQQGKKNLPAKVLTLGELKKLAGHVEDRIAERAPGAEAEVNTLRAKLRQMKLRKGQTYHVPLSRGKGYAVIGDVGDKHAVKTVLSPNMRPPGERLKLARAPRDYKREYEQYHAKPEQVENRSLRNQARRKLGLKKGDPREADHKTPLSKGGGNGHSNLRAVSRKTNRTKFTDHE